MYVGMAPTDHLIDRVRVLFIERTAVSIDDLDDRFDASRETLASVVKQLESFGEIEHVGGGDYRSVDGEIVDTRGASYADPAEPESPNNRSVSDVLSDDP